MGTHKVTKKNEAAEEGLILNQACNLSNKNHKIEQKWIFQMKWSLRPKRSLKKD